MAGGLFLIALFSVLHASVRLPPRAANRLRFNQQLPYFLSCPISLELLKL